MINNIENIMKNFENDVDREMQIDFKFINYIIIYK